jgi:hypothetical protein
MARENLGPEAHESPDSAENPRKWLRISHVVESNSVRILGIESDSTPMDSQREDSTSGTTDYIAWEVSHLNRNFVLNSNKYFIPILIIMPYLIS